MRRLPRYLVIAAIACLAMTPKLFAQAADTVVINPLPVGNINTVINGDTLTGGVVAHPNRVYVLRHGVIYQQTEPLKIDGNLTIIANDTTAGVRPPVIAPAILSDNSSIDHFFDINGVGGKLTLKNLYILSVRADGNALGWADGIRLNADSVTTMIDNCVFDGFSHTAISLNGQWNKLTVENSEFRNDMHPSSYFGGGALLSGYPVNMDTCIFVNNTFFCNNAYLWSIRGYCPLAVFDHNTIVYGTVNPFLMRRGQIMHINNNVFYAAHAYGGIPEQVITSWFENYPDTSQTSIMRLEITDSTSSYSKMWAATIGGPENFIDPKLGVAAWMVAPGGRHVEIENNSYFWPKQMLDFYKAYNDTVATKDSVDIPNGTSNGGKELMVRRLYLPTWMSNYTRYAISVIEKAGGTVDTTGNVNVDPGFDAAVDGQMSKLDAYILKIATNKLDSAWYFNPNNALYPAVWPVPENLAYTNSSLMKAGTNGYPLGDLNWFPTQKAAWLAAGGINLTSVQKLPNAVPETFNLSQNYPNPFNPTTDIKVSLKKAGVINLDVYNVLGQLVKVVDQGYKPAGEYIYNVNMDQFASGVYFYRLTQGANVMTKKMLLLK